MAQCNSTTSDDNLILCEGFLWKQSQFIKKCRKRWIVLKGQCLYSYKQKQIYNNPTEIFDLSVYDGINYQNTKLTLQFELTSTTKKTKRVFIAETNDDMMRWIINIKKTQYANSSDLESLKLYKKLVRMGFEDNISLKAAHKFKNRLDNAVEYILKYENNNNKKNDESEKHVTQDLYPNKTSNILQHQLESKVNRNIDEKRNVFIEYNNECDDISKC
eukprot:134303_1